MIVLSVSRVWRQRGSKSQVGWRKSRFTYSIQCHVCVCCWGGGGRTVACEGMSIAYCVCVGVYNIQACEGMSVAHCVCIYRHSTPSLNKRGKKCRLICSTIATGLQRYRPTSRPLKNRSIHFYSIQCVYCMVFQQLHCTCTNT